MATKIEAKYIIEEVVKWKWNIVWKFKYTNN